MNDKFQHVLNRPLVWQRTEDPIDRYKTLVDGQHWLVRINDFPEEPMYTLFICEEEIVSFDDWPNEWIR